MMKKYYVIRGEFANTYKVYSAENKETITRLLEAGAERITKKEADALCKAERDRRSWNGNYGYASDRIIDAESEFPIW